MAMIQRIEHRAIFSFQFLVFLVKFLFPPSFRFIHNVSQYSENERIFYEALRLQHVKMSVIKHNYFVENAILCNDNDDDEKNMHPSERKTLC